MTLEANDINPTKLIGKSTPDSIRRDISWHAAKPADHSIATDTRKLMYWRHPADDRIIFYNDMPGQHCAIGHHHFIPNFTVMRHVAIGHNQAVITYSDRGIFLTRRVNCDKFPNFTSLTDGDKRFLSPILQILCFGSDTGTRPYDCTITYGSISINIGVGLNHYMILEGHRAFNHSKNFDRHMIPNLRSGFYNGLRVYIRHENPILRLQLVFIYKGKAQFCFDS